MKMYKASGVEVQLHWLLTVVVEGSEWSASSSGGFTPGESASRTHFTGGGMGLKAHLGAVERRETSLLQDIEPQFLGNLVTISTELSRI
jgi:hypothetical protein